MARINIEEIWWTDRRRMRLIELLKGDSYGADGLWLNMIKTAQNHCEAGTIPLAEIIVVPHLEHLIESNLVILIQANTKQTPSKAKQLLADAMQDRAKWEQIQAYVSGSEANHDWLKKRREAARKGGGKSAKRTRSIDGKLQANAKQTEANSKQTEPSSSSSSSSSYSSSGSCSKRKNAAIRTNYPQEFEELWAGYERKGEKKKAFSNWKDLNLSESEELDLRKAMANYLKANQERQYRKDFENFLKIDWREWINPPTQLAVHRKALTKEEHIRQHNDEWFSKAMAKAQQEEGNL